VQHADRGSGTHRRHRDCRRSELPPLEPVRHADAFDDDAGAADHDHAADDEPAAAAADHDARADDHDDDAAAAYDHDHAAAAASDDDHHDAAVAADHDARADDHDHGAARGDARPAGLAVRVELAVEHAPR
jgi:hypothetical protein